MYRVKNTLPDVDTGTALAKRLLGTEELYVKKEFMTREEIVERINQIISLMGDEKNKQRFIKEVGNEEEGKKQYQKVYEDWEVELATLQKQYSRMTSDEAPDFALWDGQWDNKENSYWLTGSGTTTILVGHSRDYGDVPRVEAICRDDRGGTVRRRRGVERNIRRGQCPHLRSQRH